MTPEEFANKMRAILEDEELDKQYEHVEADGLILELLDSLGYDEGAVYYRGAMEARWWYA